jgi:hypothetical protein
MDALVLVKLSALMARSRGSPAINIGLIDGPVVTRHAGFVNDDLKEIPGKNVATCTQSNSTACLHGSLIAGILSAQRQSAAPALYPDCTLIIRPIFADKTAGSEHIPSATPDELAMAIIGCIDAGARVINLRLALLRRFPKKAGKHLAIHSP